MKGDRWKLYGIEMEESTAAKARARTGAEVFVGDAAQAPFPAGFFDVVTAFDVLEHVYDPREFLRKVMEWLKPGGIFHALVPNVASWEARLFGSYWFGLDLPRHLFHFSPQSLRKLMSVAGFEEVALATPRISYVDSSTLYLYCKMIEKMGFSPTPPAKPRPRTFARRAWGKGTRTFLIAPPAQVASWAGAGPSLEIVFRKP
jgi:SAM-dependent methyltransferase